MFIEVYIINIRDTKSDYSPLASFAVPSHFHTNNIDALPYRVCLPPVAIVLTPTDTSHIIRFRKKFRSAGQVHRIGQTRDEYTILARKLFGKRPLRRLEYMQSWIFRGGLCGSRSKWCPNLDFVIGGVAPSGSSNRW
jgi:hypothetical protein